MEKHKKILHLMAYIYLQQNKFVQALIVYRLLYVLCPKDPIIGLSLSYCLFAEDEHEGALAILEEVNALQLNQQQQVVYYLVKSKALWHLGKVEDSRAVVKKYLFKRQAENQKASEKSIQENVETFNQQADIISKNTTGSAANIP